MLLGRVVKSNSHIDYVVQVFAPGEVSDTPSPEDYAFGRFVRVAIDGSHHDLIGVIYDTLLLNPAYGTLGPRLSGDPQLTSFSPDYMPETATVVGIAVLGWRTADGEQFHYRQGVPPVASRVGAEARLLEEEEFRAFHRSSDGAMATVAYLPRLGAMANPAIPELVNGILTRLIHAFPESAPTLSVLRSNLDWNSKLGRR